jgi:hypothetical protein
MAAKSGVPASRAIAPLRFQMKQEICDEIGANILDLQSGWRFAERITCVAEQQSEGITVTGDGIGAGIHLRTETVGEEALDQRW